MDSNTDGVKVTLRRITPDPRGYNELRNTQLISETPKNYIIWLPLRRKRQLIPKSEWRIVPLSWAEMKENPVIRQAIADLHRLYINGNTNGTGNYHLYPEGHRRFEGGRGTIAPYNKELKKALHQSGHSKEDFFTIALQGKKEETKDKDEGNPQKPPEAPAKKEKPYFTMGKAKRLIAKDYSKVSDTQLQKDFVMLRDFVRFIETMENEHSFVSLVKGDYFRRVLDPYVSGVVPVDPWLYSNLRYALDEALAERTKRMQTVGQSKDEANLQTCRATPGIKQGGIMTPELHEIIADLRKHKRLVFRALKNGMELQRRDGRIYTYNTPPYAMGWLRQLDSVLGRVKHKDEAKPQKPPEAPAKKNIMAKTKRLLRLTYTRAVMPGTHSFYDHIWSASADDCKLYTDHYDQLMQKWGDVLKFISGNWFDYAKQVAEHKDYDTAITGGWGKPHATTATSDWGGSMHEAEEIIKRLTSYCKKHKLGLLQIRKHTEYIPRNARDRKKRKGIETVFVQLIIARAPIVETILTYADLEPDIFAELEQYRRDELERDTEHFGWYFNPEICTEQKEDELKWLHNPYPDAIEEMEEIKRIESELETPLSHIPNYFVPLTKFEPGASSLLHPSNQPKQEKQPTSPPPKEPWQMTRAEVIISALTGLPTDKELSVQHVKGSKIGGHLFRTVDQIRNDPSLVLGSIDETGDASIRGKRYFDGWKHHKAIKQALAEGKPVPPEVLANYPDLQPKNKDEAKDKTLDIVTPQNAVTDAVSRETADKPLDISEDKQEPAPKKGTPAPKKGIVEMNNQVVKRISELKVGDLLVQTVTAWGKPRTHFVRILQVNLQECKARGITVDPKDPSKIAWGYGKDDWFTIWEHELWNWKTNSTYYDGFFTKVQSNDTDLPLPETSLDKEDNMAQEETKPVAMDGKIIALVGDIVVIETTYKGKKKIDVRRLFENGDGALHPSKQGIRLTKEQWAAILEALATVVEVA